MAANSLCRLWRLTSAVALAETVILTAAGQPPPAEPQIGNWKLPKLVKSPLATPAPSDNAIQRFRKERYMAALTVALATNEGFQAGTAQGTLDRLAEAHLGLLQTEFDLRPTPADQIVMLEKVVEVAAFCEKMDETRFSSGRIPVTDYEETKCRLLDARIKLLEAKHAINKPGTGAPAGGPGKAGAPAAERQNPPPDPLPPMRPLPGAGNVRSPFTDSFAAMAAALKPLPLVAVDPRDDELTRLRKERYQCARVALHWRLESFNAGVNVRPDGSTGQERLLACVTERFLAAELALTERAEDKLAAYDRALAILKWIELVNDSVFRAGHWMIQDLEQSRSERLNMEIKVLEAKRALPARQGP
jgi:hypothetical protein